MQLKGRRDPSVLKSKLCNLCHLFCHLLYTTLQTVDSMDAFLVPRPTDSDADAASDATTPTDSDATEHAAEVQGRGSLLLQQQVMLQSAPPPTYEVELLQHWARSRPVARIFMATVADRRACRALRATWALHCLALCGQHIANARDVNICAHYATCRGCGDYPTYRTCVGCHIKWCGACHTWSQVCWKCYRPRHELHDCGEFLPGRGGPGGNGRFE